MKRYTPSSCNSELYAWMEDGVMLSQEDGEYIKYEDVENVITNFIDNLLHWDNAREVARKFIKDFGE